MEFAKRLWGTICGRRRVSIPLILLLAVIVFSSINVVVRDRQHLSYALPVRFADFAQNVTTTLAPPDPNCPGLLTPAERERRPVLRAIVAFFSVYQMVPYLGQLKWLMRSLLEVMKTEPESWRTDIVLYVENTTMPQLLSLGCSTTPRQNATEPFRCVLVQYTKVRNRTISRNSTEYDRDIKEQLGDYGYADSMVPLAELPAAYLKYDIVIKSDLDVFFTPAFSRWVPPNCALVIGAGGYSTQFNMIKLGRIAEFNHAYFNGSIWNVGSTWIGPANIIAKVAERAVFWMLHISRYEFTPLMRQSKWWSGAQLWPDWHYGVLGMYGSHMAVNEVTQAGNAYPLQKGNFDHPATSPANCTGDDGPLHVHTYQTDEYFSKYVFEFNKYTLTGNNTKALQVLPSFWNSTRCKDYAGYIAGDSLRLSDQELYGKLIRGKVPSPMLG